MKPLLDADVLLDIALDRAPFFADSRLVTRWCQERVHTAAVTWHTIANLYYVLQRVQSDTKARTYVSDILRFARVVSGDNDVVWHALAMQMSDFEDAMQVAAALAADSDVVVTRNLRDFRNAPLPAISPREFVRRTETG